MSMMYCFHCDRPIDTDYFGHTGHQFDPEFKSEDCVETEILEKEKEASKMPQHWFAFWMRSSGSGI